MEEMKENEKQSQEKFNNASDETTKERGEIVRKANLKAEILNSSKYKNSSDEQKKLMDDEMDDMIDKAVKFTLHYIQGNSCCPIKIT